MRRKDIESALLTVAKAIKDKQLIVNRQAFSAYADTKTTMVDAVATKITLDAEEFDYESAFDITNSKFTAKIAGVYQFNAQVKFDGGITGGVLFSARLYVNGTVYRYGNQLIPASYSSVNISTVIELEVGDYVELYAYQDTGGDEDCATGALNTYFNGYMIAEKPN